MSRAFLALLVTAALLRSALADEPAKFERSALAERFGAASEYHSPSLSPDGTRVVAVRWADDGTSELTMDDFSGSGLRRVFAHAADMPRLESCTWKTETLFLCVTSRFRDSVLKNLVAVSADGTGERDLIDNFFAIETLMADDPTHVFVRRRNIFDTAWNRTYGTSVGTLDVTTGVFNDAKRFCGGAYWITDNDGVGRVCNSERSFGVRPTPTANWVVFHPYRFPGPDWFYPLAFDERTTEVFYAELLNGRFALFAKAFAGDSSTRTVLADSFASVVDVESIGKRARPAMAAVRDGLTRWEPIDPLVARVRSAVQRSFPAAVINVEQEDWNQRFYLVWVQHESGPARGEYYRFDARDEQLDRFGPASEAGVGTSAAPTTRVEFKTNDGSPAVVHVRFPAGATEPAPLVVIPSGRWGGADFVVPFLTASGYAVAWYPFERLQPSVRMGAGWRSTMAELEASIAELARGGKIDPKRVCALSRDVGAYSVLMAASERPALFRCVVGIETEVKPYDRATSLLARVPQISMPVLLFQQTSSRGADKLHEALASKGVRAELIDYDDMSFDLSRYRIDLLTRLGDWLGEYLSP